MMEDAGDSKSPAGQATICLLGRQGRVDASAGCAFAQLY